MLRFYQIDKQIKAGKYPSISKLANDLEVKPRTIERDIERMRDSFGADIVYDRRRKGYYYTSDNFRLPPLHLNEGEAAALFLGQKLLAQCAGTPFESAIRSAFEKICAYLPESISIDCNAIDSSISFDVQPLRGDNEYMAALFAKFASAMTARKTVWFKYYSPSTDQTTKRCVDPYHLHNFQGAWYVIGYCHLRQNFRTFSVDRIMEFNETVDSFIIKPEFSLKEYLAAGLGIEAGNTTEKIAIRFDEFQARYIRERQWHKSQRIEENDDGSLILHLEVGGLGEVKRWVLGFASHAEVLSPESLRVAVRDELKRAWEVYRDRE